ETDPAEISRLLGILYRMRWQARELLAELHGAKRWTFAPHLRQTFRGGAGSPVALFIPGLLSLFGGGEQGLIDAFVMSSLIHVTGAKTPFKSRMGKLEQDGGMRAWKRSRQLAERIGLPFQTVCSSIERLVKRGLVIRPPSVLGVSDHLRVAPTSLLEALKG